MILQFFLCIIFLSGLQPLSAAIPAVIIDEIEDFKNQQELPGLAVGIYYEGKPYFLNFGYSHPARRIKVTKDTIFDIASVTKPFVATMLAYQVKQNKMKLRDPLSLYFIRLENHPCALSTVTPEQLASHTSGLPRESSIQEETQCALIKSLLDWQPEYPPGSDFIYSNLGYRILRYALENSENTPFVEMLEQEILDPLAMDSSFLHVPAELKDRFAEGFDKDGNPAPHVPNIALKSTTVDLMSFLMANIGLRGPVKLYQAMQLAHRGVFQINPTTIQALGWIDKTIDGFRIIEKNGGIVGYSSWLGWTTPQNTGLILLANKSCSALTKFARELLIQLTNL